MSALLNGVQGYLEQAGKDNHFSVKLHFVVTTSSYLVLTNNHNRISCQSTSDTDASNQTNTFSTECILSKTSRLTMSSSTDKKPMENAVEQPPKEQDGASATKEKTTARNEVPKLDTRMIISAGENACPEGMQRNHLGECVPIFMD